MNLTQYRDRPGKFAMLGTVAVGPVVFHTLEDVPGGEAEGEPVPAGTYRLVPHDSKPKPPSAAHPKGHPGYGKIWAMVNPELGIYHQPGDIPKGKTGRFACLWMHSGNRHEDTLGCVLGGMARGTETVTRSREAIALLKDTLPWVEHSLTIVNA